MNPLRRKTIIEINHHCVTNSILVVNEMGELKKLDCPIGALLVENPMMKIYIEEIKINTELELLYLIQGKLYPYYFFELQSE